MPTSANRTNTQCAVPEAQLVFRDDSGALWCTLVLQSDQTTYRSAAVPRPAAPSRSSAWRSLPDRRTRPAARKQTTRRLQDLMIALITWFYMSEFITKCSLTIVWTLVVHYRVGIQPEIKTMWMVISHPTVISSFTLSHIHTYTHSHIHTYTLTHTRADSCSIIAWCLPRAARPSDYELMGARRPTCEVTLTDTRTTWLWGIRSISC